MKNLHTRIIVLNYFEDEVPLHATDKEQQEWYAALGRMVAYGLYHDRNPAEESTTQYVRLGLGRTRSRLTPATTSRSSSCDTRIGWPSSLAPLMRSSAI